MKIDAVTNKWDDCQQGLNHEFQFENLIPNALDVTNVNDSEQTWGWMILNNENNGLIFTLVKLRKPILFTLVNPKSIYLQSVPKVWFG